MKNVIVKTWMTANPITVSPEMTLPEAHQLMKEQRVRRLPVVDKDKHLVGIISLSDVLEAEPSDATTLSIYELNYLLAKLTVQKIMTRDVYMLSPEDSIATAARLMLEKKIGGLPVVENGHVVGIITESDIFRMVVQEYA